ncbi:heme o synthase [Amylibacter sp.]|jgi:protoheme IX farnesyltransferase|nr:protoheme IX farnesyltransferase [alpha proteobacterium HTCC2255] [Rhodobacterales bacterium HTCC2255]MBT3952730.1 protoheme IX farnesyltransferase [Rhodobacterales bacterium]MDA9894847.1 heme o synthase [Amylibacter sp.]MBT4133315.1 protoheme IX farnesyltransferase [Rhodobacterales bacterium]MBT4323309.1 protoheme IX farnesyltransferase [Rhodobacterales bacterium]
MTETIIKTTSDQTDFGNYISLLKPRVMSLVVFTAAVGLIVAPGSMNVVLAFASVLFIALGAGASGSLNMWWDADIDSIMKRTQERPVPSGKVSANNAMLVGLWMSVLSVGMLGLASNWLAAALLAFTIFFYAVIYSMWLKRSTPQNIVIGGAAGAFPPMVGWVAASGSVSIEAIGMFMLIFMWTPPHFWALALFMNEDYSKAGIPMLTVTHGKKSTRNHILTYTVLLTPFSIGLAFTSIGGPIYFTLSIILSLMFLLGSLKLFRRNEKIATEDNYTDERKLFKFSLFYLFLLFTALLIEALMRSLDISLIAWPQVF